MEVPGVVVISLLLISLISLTYGAMSEKQIKAASRLVKNTCQPKTTATDEDIDNMHQGIWDVDHTAKCYMYCALIAQKLIVKDGTLDYEFAIGLAKKYLPESTRDAVILSLESCKDAGKNLDDKCEAAYEFSKCVYLANPAVYFFP